MSALLGSIVWWVALLCAHMFERIPVYHLILYTGQSDWLNGTRCCVSERMYCTIRGSSPAARTGFPECCHSRGALLCPGRPVSVTNTFTQMAGEWGAGNTHISTTTTFQTLARVDSSSDKRHLSNHAVGLSIRPREQNVSNHGTKKNMDGLPNQLHGWKDDVCLMMN